MKKIFIYIMPLVFAFTGLSSDLDVQSIPISKIKKILPDEWKIESIDTARTVSGWKKISGSDGIHIKISRTPYSEKKYRTKSGQCTVQIPKIDIYVFPDDFVGKHANTSAIFKKGQIIEDKRALSAKRAVLIMEKFIPVGNWYVFHNAPSFRDWKTPIDDVVKIFRSNVSK